MSVNIDKNERQGKHGETTLNESRPLLIKNKVTQNIMCSFIITIFN